ncbi:hypothetical protein D3C80_1264890 [compost metagenome]
MKPRRALVPFTKRRAIAPANGVLLLTASAISITSLACLMSIPIAALATLPLNFVFVNISPIVPVIGSPGLKANGNSLLTSFGTTFKVKPVSSIKNSITPKV